MKTLSGLILAFFSLALVFFSSDPLIPKKLESPPGFPEIRVPTDNAYTDARWELGKRVFFDTILSIDQSISCASCHQPKFAFADNQAKSPGAFKRPGTRNAPSLINVAYQPYLLREGSVPTIEMQVLVPIQEKNEMAHNIVEIAKLMSKDSTYQNMSRMAYDRPIDPYVISRSLGVFQRSLIGATSAFDYYEYHGKKGAMSESALRGKALFFSAKTNCAKCHAGYNFTNYLFANTGLYADYVDEGRMRFTHDSSDLAKFKTPSLRNVAITAPYMHDGSLNSLKEVLDHYKSGGENHPSKSKFIRAFELSEEQENDLLAFLESLSDEIYLNKE